MRKVLHVILVVAFLSLLVAGAAAAQGSVLYVPAVMKDAEKTWFTLEEFYAAMRLYGYPPEEYAEHTSCVPTEWDANLFVVCDLFPDEEYGGTTVIAFFWSAELDTIVAMYASQPAEAK